MKVVKVARNRPFKDSCTVYIGRPSIFGNPFRIDATTDRMAACSQYEAYARSKPDLMRAIRKLPKDAVLGCWCAPLLCHGNVIVKLWREMNETIRTAGAE